MLPNVHMSMVTTESGKAAGLNDAEVYAYFWLCTMAVRDMPTELQHLIREKHRTANTIEEVGSAALTAIIQWIKDQRSHPTVRAEDLPKFKLTPEEMEEARTAVEREGFSIEDLDRRKNV